MKVIVCASPLMYPGLDQMKVLRNPANGEEEENRARQTPLVNIPSLNLVTDFPLDYLHLCLLGVMRKLLYAYLSGPLRIRLRPIDTEKNFHLILSFRSFIPSCYSRKIRSSFEIKHWKGTEFRFFLLLAARF